MERCSVGALVLGAFFATAACSSDTSSGAAPADAGASGNSANGGSGNGGSGNAGSGNGGSGNAGSGNGGSGNAGASGTGGSTNGSGGSAGASGGGNGGTGGAAGSGGAAGAGGGIVNGPLPEGDNGIAAKHPGDVGIDSDPDVIFGRTTSDTLSHPSSLRPVDGIPSTKTNTSPSRRTLSWREMRPRVVARRHAALRT